MRAKSQVTRVVREGHLEDAVSRGVRLHEDLVAALETLENAAEPRKQRRDVVALVEHRDEDGQVDVVFDHVHDEAR